MSARDSNTTRRRRVVIVAAAVAVVVGLGWAGHWYTHPTVFAEVGNTSEMKLSEERDTAFFGVVDASDSDERVTLTSATPRITRNTANATVTLHVCTIDRSTGGGIGVVYAEDVEHFCLTAEPVARGTEFALDGSQQVIAEVTVSRPGVVGVDGFDLTYRHGWQRGTQATGSRLRITRG